MTLVRRSATLLTGEVAARLLGIALYSILARVLGVERFGIISLGMTVGLVVGSAVDLGQSAHASRLVASGQAGARGVLHILLANKAVLGVIASSGAVLLLALTGFGIQQTLVVAVMALWTTALSVFESERALLRAIGMPRRDATANGLESLLRVIVVAGIALAGGSMLSVASGFVVEAVLAATVLTYLVLRWAPLPAHEVEYQSALGFLRKSAPIGLGAVSLATFYRTDQLFVAGIAGASANGIYAAAARVAFTGCVAAQLVVSAAYPDLAALHRDPLSYGRALRQALLVVTTASVGAAVSIGVLAGPIVALLYGESYASSVGLLRVLSLTVLFNGMSVLGLYSGAALHREKTSLVLILVLTPVVLVAYYVGVRLHGAAGAAWVSVAAEGTLAAGLLFLSRDRLFSSRTDTL